MNFHNLRRGLRDLPKRYYHGRGGLISSGSTNGIQWFNAHASNYYRTSDFRGMEVYMFGTAAAAPSRWRNCTCIAMRSNTSTWLFDAGDGCQHQLLNAPLISYGNVDRIFITHMHGDHVFGLPGLLTSMLTLLKGVNAGGVHVYGPRGLRTFISSALNYMDARAHQSFRIFIHELVMPGEGPSPTPTGAEFGISDTIEPNSDGTWTVAVTDTHQVTAAPLTHRVTCFGYVVKEIDKPGTLLVDKVIERGVKPGPILQQLKAGIPIPAPDGSTIFPHEVLGPSIHGRKLVVLGDTCNSARITDAAMDADLLIHESTIPEDDNRARHIGHSTPHMAGRFAASINAKAMLLTHFSNKFASEYTEANLRLLRPNNSGFSESSMGPDQASDRLSMVDHSDGSASVQYVAVREFGFPEATDRSAMQWLFTRPAQEASGLQNVLAARDFMAVPVRPHHNPAKPILPTTAAPAPTSRAGPAGIRSAQRRPGGRDSDGGSRSPRGASPSPGRGESRRQGRKSPFVK